jgi:epsilon-lactone hydrolase
VPPGAMSGAMSYTGDADPNDPMVSPALSPEILARFPPTLLLTGTRSYDMSAAVQTHRELTKAGAKARLHLWDGLGHGFLLYADLPESKEAYAVIISFFDSSLGRSAHPTSCAP